jgi:uncharacterized Zn finger protein
MQARGGIKARSRHGDEFGASWWARRWNAVLEAFPIGQRLTRGRSYARAGQVLAIQIDKGRVTARVQGSRPRPYEIAVQVKPLSDDQWLAVADALIAQVWHAAKLFAGQMPPDIEEVFHAAGVELFPVAVGDLSTKCTCPDWSSPCKHVVAVYSLLGEEFDRDPFLLFTLRGRTRDELLTMLGATGVEPSGAATIAPVEPPSPLPADPALFWSAPQLVPPPTDLGPLAAPPVPAAPLRRLGPFPFWRGPQPVLTALEGAYIKGSAHALQALGGPIEEADAITGAEARASQSRKPRRGRPPRGRPRT